MHIHSFLFFTAAVVHGTALLPRQTYLNGPCTGADGVTGVCVSKSSCTSDGGIYIHNACLRTPDDIKCCTKPSCQREALNGDCRWVDQCDTEQTLRGLCPGPASFRCCVNPQEPPSSPSVSSKPTSTLQPTTAPKPKPNIGEQILAKAKEAKGIPYHWAGGNCKGPTGGGFDCSGLVSWAVCQVTGRDLFSEGLRVTRSMYCASEKKLKYEKVPWKDRRAGDAVFFGGKCNCETNPKGIHHVGIMMDDGWTMWNALKTGTKIRKDNFKNWSEGPCEYVIRF